jgi:cobalamin-dependent methionine synthase I
MSTEDKKVSAEDSELEQVAETEHEYLHQRLRQELGREPTEEELDNWL